MIYESQIVEQQLLDVAGKMIIAARTAPKTRGIDYLTFSIVNSYKEKESLASKMKEIGENTGAHFFGRDAENILKAPVIVLFGATIKTMNLPNCGICGFTDCEGKDKYPDVPCSYNNIDLGIAIGSAVGVAMDHRVDNRIMYTIGMAALELNLMGEETKIILGVPLNSSSKNLFFDRK